MEIKAKIKGVGSCLIMPRLSAEPDWCLPSKWCVPSRCGSPGGARLQASVATGDLSMGGKRSGGL